MLYLSNVLAFNVGGISFLLLDKTRFAIYFRLPLVIASIIVSRNFFMKCALERIYYPLEPIYQEIRKHRTVTKQNPKGINTIDKLRFQGDDFVPIEERTDLSPEDKEKERILTLKRL